MVMLEQITLLESKIARAVSFVERLTEENARLEKQYKELEATIEKLREEKTKAEAGIISVLGKLNQFEDTIERSLSSVRGNSAGGAASAPAMQRPTTAPLPAVVAGAAAVGAAAGAALASAAIPSSATLPTASLPRAPLPTAPLPTAYTEEENPGDDDVEDAEEVQLEIF